NTSSLIQIYTLSLHDALPIYIFQSSAVQKLPVQKNPFWGFHSPVWLSPSVKKPSPALSPIPLGGAAAMTGSHFAAVRSISFCRRDRKSTRLNSSHGSISYAVF